MIAVKLFGKAYSRHTGFNLLVLCCALLYAAVMIYLLFYRHRYYFDGYMYNLTPFRTLKNYIFNRDHYNFDTWFKNLFGNLILFIPIGIFMPLLHTGFRAVVPLVAGCAVLIFAVELLQMLLRVGSFDIDDIILNTVGAWLGLMLIKPFISRRRKGG